MFIRRSTAMLFVIMIGSFLWLSTDINAAQKAVINVEPLNVRSGPGLSHEKVGEVHKEDTFPILQEKDNWVQIQLEESKGWVAKWLIKLEQDDLSSSSNVTSSVNDLRIRSGAGTSYRVIGSMDQGDSYPLKGSSGEWVQLSYKNQNGWVSKQFVTTDQSVATTSQPEESVKESPPSTDRNDKGEIVIKTPILNVRSEGNLGSKIVSQVKEGEQYTYIQEKGSWYEIKYSSGKTGWVANWLVKKVASKPEETHSVTLLYNGTNIRKGPSTANPIVGRGSKGQQFNVIGHENKWYEISYNGGSAYVADWIVASRESTIEQLSDEEQSIAGKTVVIDAGHGGRDVGTIGHDGNYEKKLTLMTAQRLKERLELAGANVILTRSDDSYIALNSRATKSNVLGADAFLSLHYNSFPQSPTVSGIGTYYYHNQHKAFAEAVQNAMVKATGLHDRQARFGDFHVIRENRQPALLLELGFLSNQQEEKYVHSKEFQNKVTNGIVQGIIDYLGE
ncbi:MULTISPECIES: N-acetylmuramoyl-L-alanine amidase [Pontibacillus]|uniref:N-acetylmuramoyl-L-alanine amidase n=1 Tax=Pontibacillus chungwhensis TaxID=265426 RepID=A0ABY8UTS0_9BACI|nr:MULTISPECIES: N-acetylmuramoyl-L-alanine amidase [Pontibacillus]MCD5323687.1 N-acetylmuramoyl-L-alanine amidase [Pontibacillus sp. HN14]WIF97052.1 N-acetylmuramoyl-L-alanine amidase [Pontibacillus chungwhensis]